MIGLQASQRFLKLAHGDVLVAPMRTDLGHHDSAVPLALERATQPFLAQALMIFPGIVEEVHAGIQCLIYNLCSFSLTVRRPQVVSADSQCRNLQTGAPQRPLGYFRAGLAFSRQGRGSKQQRLRKSSSGYMKSRWHII